MSRGGNLLLGADLVGSSSTECCYNIAQRGTREMNIRLSTFLIPLALSLAAFLEIGRDQASVRSLPQPSGSFPVGRVAYDWTDSSRREALSDDSGARRELMVYVWYPSAPPGPRATRADYLPRADKIDQDPLGQQFKKSHSDIWPLIMSGAIQTHTFQNAPVAGNGQRFPVILLLHGGGVPGFAYSSQIEDFVSHGYVVVTIEHPYENGVVVFSDGRVAPMSPTVEIYRKMGSPEAHAWEQGRDDVWAADTSFVIDQLSKLAADKKQASEFFGKIDLDRIGIVGHSIGGRAGARACQLDVRIKACANEDGYLTSDGPILTYENMKFPTQPFLFVQAMPKPLSDEQLASAHITRRQFDLMLADARAAIRSELEKCSGGSYWAILNLPGFEHYGFTDLPLLGHADASIDESHDVEGLQVARSLVRSFFNKHLRGETQSLLDMDAALPAGVHVQRFGKVRHLAD
jgi:predicted dienelactone hydrolase